ncbi:MAG TPA: DinB family protein [Candidatus Dormibacteraeota bacterium]|nr:DinB family protein [Candidatus Dormibacteraeota bacterium]
MYDTQLSIDEVLRALAEQPRTIAKATRGVSDERLRRSPGAGEWSVNDVLAHLRSCADMWGKYIALIVEEDHPTFRAVNPRTWINSTNYPGLDFAVSFRAYSKQRETLVQLLRALPKSAWSRAATVTGAGSPRERTVLEYARWLANHERSHLRQIARLSGS